MKRIEFDEGGFGDLSGTLQELFADPRDPRSGAYRRVLIRPRISWCAMLLWCLVPLAVAAGLGIGLWQLDWDLWACVCLPLTLLVLLVLLRLRQLIICLVRIYQRLAPASVRCKCRFEPSCSEYMIGALRSYGCRKGLQMGIHRLRRCKPGDGGWDPLPTVEKKSIGQN